MPDEKLLAKPEACEILGGISARELDRLLAAGDLKAVRIGRRVFVALSEAKRFIGALPARGASRGA